MPKASNGQDTFGQRCPLPPELAFTTVKPHDIMAFTAGDLLTLSSNDHSAMGEGLGFTLPAGWGTGGGQGPWLSHSAPALLLLRSGCHPSKCKTPLLRRLAKGKALPSRLRMASSLGSCSGCFTRLLLCLDRTIAAFQWLLGIAQLMQMLVSSCR